MTADEARTLLEASDQLHVTRGKRVLSFDDPGAAASVEEALSLILGRSGTLRAPAFRVGRMLFVGYNDDLLALVR